MSRLLDQVIQTLRGKSLPRILLNMALSADFAALQGSILDVGGGRSSYERHFDRERAAIVSTNIDAGRGPTAPFDFNQAFPFAESSFDAVLTMNVLYIMRDPDAAAREIFRILKPGGRWYASTPFVFPENPEPEDYRRPTSMELKRLTAAAGFSLERLVPVGGRAVSAEALIDPMFAWPVLKILPRLAALALDASVFKGLNRLHPAPPLYYWVARKPS